jgi:hypothetical protein
VLLTLIVVFLTGTFFLIVGAIQQEVTSTWLFLLSTPISLWLLIRARHNWTRLLNLYRSRDALLSQYELVLSSNGFQTRTNGSNVRSLWKMFRDVRVEPGLVTAHLIWSNDRTNLFNREVIHNDEDWERICDYATKHIA